MRTRVLGLAGGSACMLLSGPAAAGILSAQPFVGVIHHQIVKAYNEPAGSPTFGYPRELVVNIIEVDLTAPGVAFRMQPGNGADPGEVTRITTRNYVNSAGAQIGINGDFFSLSPPYPFPYTDVTHAGASNGDIYSANAGGESIFNVSGTNDARILRANGPGTTTTQEGIPLYNAIGGNQRILTNGAVTAPDDTYTNTLNPHTAIAVNQARTKVFFMTVDGRQTDYSEGMKTTEMADLFLQFGGWDAINVDGGGSTTMVMDDSNDALQNARVINSPSDNSTPQMPGTERQNGNNFAIFATPNPGYVPLPTPGRPPAVPALPTISQQVIIDDFEGTKGHFASAVNASGSSANIAASSSSALDTSRKHTGNSSIRVDIVNTNASPARMQLRFLSGGGTAANNVINGQALGPEGYVGYFLRVEPSSAPLWAAIMLDDGNTSSNGLERSSFLPIIADGEFHLYQWNLADAGLWDNFNAGNGAIGGPNVFIDSIYLSSAPANSGGTNWSGSVWIDTVAYNPNGTLDNLIPEPASCSIICLASLMIARRRR